MQDAIQAIGICEYENSRWKRVMEDTWSYRDCFGGDSNQCYFAVFDGYNGVHAAEYSCQ
jgi:serine/threonine protein phosphatase PrpC